MTDFCNGKTWLVMLKDMAKSNAQNVTCKKISIFFQKNFTVFSLRNKSLDY